MKQFIIVSYYVVINTNVTNESCSIDTTNVSPNAHESLPVCVPVIECEYTSFNCMHI